ncbi:MAG: FkbM family methyltransferase [Burkholderiales bacterium]|nr:FkbM family methyltransferase [Burkholderiales bacterium]
MDVLLARSEYDGALTISEQHLILAIGLPHIDFLKCDIEGGEFSLFGPECALLRMTKRLAIAIHAFAGDVRRSIEVARCEGFEILSTNWDQDGTAVVFAEKRRTRQRDRVPSRRAEVQL